MADAAHSTSVSKSHNGHVFDVYAPAYVPNNLKLVNTYPARVVTSKAAPWTDYEQFVQTFAGSSFLQAKQPPSLRTLKPPATIETPLERLNYQSWFDAALVEEIASLQNECENHALYQVPLVQTVSSNRQRVKKRGRGAEFHSLMTWNTIFIDLWYQACVKRACQ